MHVKWCLWEIQIKKISLQNKMAVKVTKKVIYAMALYHKINVTRSTFYVESFMFFKKCTTFGLCCPTLSSICFNEICFNEISFMPYDILNNNNYYYPHSTLAKL